MSRSLNVSIASVAAALLLSGPAFAASLQPAAGEGPFFNDVTVRSNVQRQDVRADAARHMPAAGEMSAQAKARPASATTRAAVRASTRDAIAHGFRVASGENA